MPFFTKALRSSFCSLSKVTQVLNCGTRAETQRQSRIFVLCCLLLMMVPRPNVSVFYRVMLWKSSVFPLELSGLQKLSILPNESKNPLRPNKEQLNKMGIIYLSVLRGTLWGITTFQMSPSSD